MAVAISEEDLLLYSNQLNIALARSSRLLNSWKSKKPVAQDLEEDNDEAAFNEEEFKSATEDGGVGSKSAPPEGELQPDGSFLSKKYGSNDRLLANLLGEKAAQARKKTQTPGKAMSASKHAAPKPLAARLKVSRYVDSEEEDEGGRAGAFKSRRHDRSTQPVKDAKPDDEQMGDAAAADDDDEEETSVTQRAASINQVPVTTPPTTSKPTKQKATSYLDEILAQKANKKSKKKKKSKS